MKKKDEPPATANLSFVVRMWLEEVDDDTQKAIWRGQVKNVLSGESIYFQDLASLKVFIEEQTRNYSADV